MATALYDGSQQRLSRPHCSMASKTARAKARPIGTTAGVLITAPMAGCPGQSERRPTARTLRHLVLVKAQAASVGLQHNLDWYYSKLLPTLAISLTLIPIPLAWLECQYWCSNNPTTAMDLYNTTIAGQGNLIVRFDEWHCHGASGVAHCTSPLDKSRGMSIYLKDALRTNDSFYIPGVAVHQCCWFSWC